MAAPLKATRTLSTYQLGWSMATLDCQLSKWEIQCGEGSIRRRGWIVGQAKQLEGGDWRVEFWGNTPSQRQLAERFNILKVGV